MEYMTAKEAAHKWNITVRRVQALCSQRRIQGAIRLGNMWVLPIAAKKPEGKRYTHKNVEDK